MKYSKKELIAKVSEKTGYQEEDIAEMHVTVLAGGKIILKSTEKL